MDLEKRESLKKDFENFRILKYKFQKARNANERKASKKELTYILEKLRQYDLHKYDPCIELETYDLDALEYDIKEILNK